jgi:hypothetical protein
MHQQMSESLGDSWAADDDDDDDASEVSEVENDENVEVTPEETKKQSVSIRKRQKMEEWKKERKRRKLAAHQTAIADVDPEVLISDESRLDLMPANKQLLWLWGMEFLLNLHAMFYCSLHFQTLLGHYSKYAAKNFQITDLEMCVCIRILALI